MSGEESTGNTPKTNVETSVADDKRSIMLKLEWGRAHRWSFLSTRPQLICSAQRWGRLAVR
jgi:hypothetical protein